MKTNYVYSEHIQYTAYAQSKHMFLVQFSTMFIPRTKRQFGMYDLFIPISVYLYVLPHPKFVPHKILIFYKISKIASHLTGSSKQKGGRRYFNWDHRNPMIIEQAWILVLDFTVGGYFGATWHLVSSAALEKSFVNESLWPAV
jgi:hypothetical protein